MKEVELKEKSLLRGGCKIMVNGKGSFVLGENSYIYWSSVMATGGKAKIQIGKDCAISWNVNMIAYDLHAYQDKDFYGDIKVGDKVWIGANATILKNVEIGEGCIVAANSLVTSGSYPSNSLIAGNPAKVIKENIELRILTKEEKLGL